MRSCFGFMFWGMLLVALDFKFKDFDPLPNFVGGLGCALVAIGAGGLAPMTANLVAATAIGWLLVLIYSVVPFLTVSAGAARSLDVAVPLLNGAMVWTTLAGVGDIAVGRNRQDLAKRAMPLRVAYAAFVAVMLVADFTFEGSESALQALTAMFVVAVVVVMGLILHLLYRTWRELIK